MPGVLAEFANLPCIPRVEPAAVLCPGHNGTLADSFGAIWQHEIFVKGPV